MIMNEVEIMAAMPRDLQYETLFILIPSYDVQFDIEYIYERPLEETRVYHFPYELGCANMQQWYFLAAPLLKRYGCGVTPSQYLSKLVELMRKG